jgi:hypothetical protein
VFPKHFLLILVSANSCALLSFWFFLIHSLSKGLFDFLLISFSGPGYKVKLCSLALAPWLSTC